MRIWYQSSTAIHMPEMAAYRERLTAFIDSVKRPDVEIDIRGVDCGSTSLEYNFVEYLNSSSRDGGTLQQMLRAEREGYDGIAIGCFLDPAYEVAKELIDIPILSICQASMHVACWLGEKFSGIAFCDKQAQRYTRQARLYGLQDRMIPFRTLSMDLLRQLEGIGGGRPVIDQFVDEARKLAAAGAEVIIPASGTLQPVVHEAGLREVDGARILDPVATLVKMTEALVDLSRLAGVKTSRRLLFAGPDRARRDEILELYGVLKPVER